MAQLAAKGEGMFAFQLGDDADGELAIGGYNKERMEGDEPHWVNLVKAGYWLISMDEVRFGDLQTDGAVGGIMDTGTSLIYGPQSQVSGDGRLVHLSTYRFKKSAAPKFTESKTRAIANVSDARI